MGRKEGEDSRGNVVETVTLIVGAAKYLMKGLRVDSVDRVLINHVWWGDKTVWTERIEVVECDWGKSGFLEINGRRWV